jgi:phage tail-like protein
MIKTRPDKILYRTIVPEMVEKENGKITLDSGIVSCQWHRIHVETDDKITISISTFDKDGPSESSKCTIVFNCSFKDGFIDSSPGQYVTIDIGNQKFKWINIYYPRITSLRFLPEIYSQDENGLDFLERFLSLFETVLAKTDHKIEKFSNLFDPTAVSLPLDIYVPEDAYWSEWLDWLSTWVSVDLYDQLSEYGKREFLKKSVMIYKKKGTLEGLAELVSLLVNTSIGSGNNEIAPIRVRIKELKNNLFRSYCMENEEEYKNPIDRNTGGNESNFQCNPPYKKCSLTFNTNDLELIKKINTSEDAVHYTYGKYNNHFYHPSNICIYIFLTLGNSVISKETLYSIITSFLPVFVTAEVVFVDENQEYYEINNIQVKYNDKIYQKNIEVHDIVYGTYRDYVNWEVLYSNKNSNITNNLKYRSVGQASHEFPI